MTQTAARSSPYSLTGRPAKELGLPIWNMDHAMRRRGDDHRFLVWGRNTNFGPAGFLGAQGGFGSVDDAIEAGSGHCPPGGAVTIARRGSTIRSWRPGQPVRGAA